MYNERNAQYLVRANKYLSNGWLFFFIMIGCPLWIIMAGGGIGSILFSGLFLFSGGMWMLNIWFYISTIDKIKGRNYNHDIERWE